MIASLKPRSSMIRPSTTYMTPMRLWSTLVSHSRHRYGHQPFTVTVTRTARMTMPTTAPLSSGSGSLKGIADQLSLPNTLTSCLTHWRMRGSRTRPCLVEDALEQLRFHRTIDCGRYVLTRPCQFRVAGIVEAGSGAARPLEPSVEIASGHRLDGEPHPGEALPAEICRKAWIFARPVCEKVEM